MAKRKGKGKRRATAAQIRARARFARLYGGRKRKGAKRAGSKRRRSVKRSSRRGSAAPIVVLGPGGSFTRKYRGKKGRRTMARKRRSVRRRRSGRRGFGGGGKFGGFFSREVMATVGGAAVAGFVGPKIAGYLPASWANSAAGRIGAALVVGGVGFLALKRFNRQAALGFAAAAVAPAISGEIARRTGGVSGYGAPDGLDYLPDVSGYVGALDSGDYPMNGLGEYEADAVELY